MIGLILVGMALQAAQAERYGVIITSGVDTVAVERVERDGRTARSEVLIPRLARLAIVATTDGRGCVSGALVSVFPWGSSRDATPLQRVSLRLDGDSVRLDVRASDVGRSLSRAFPGARFVLLGESDALSALAVECALAEGEGADSVEVPAVVFPGLRALAMRVTRRGDRAVVVAGDTVWAELDAHGRARRMVVGRGERGRVITRVAAGVVEGLQIAPSDYSVPPGAPYLAEQVRFEVEPGVVLAGTLTIPLEVRGPVVAVVTVSGSGPQDRDSYAPVADGWRPFRQFADTLARRGYAVLRFDDRGVGGSTGDFGGATERTTAADVLAAVAYLRSRADIDGHRVVLLGHSEGVRVAMLAAAQDRAVSGLVLMSGAADPRAAVRAQALWLAEHGPATSRLPRDYVLALVDRQMDSLAVAGQRDVYRWDAGAVARDIRAAAVAIFHGGTDRQVPSDQAGALAAVFRRAGARAVNVRVFPGLNHLLVRDPSGDFTRYHLLPSARVDTAVLGALSDWLDGLRRGARTEHGDARFSR